MASVKERLHKGYAQSMELSGRPLADEKSHYQRIKIFDTVANGRVMKWSFGSAFAGTGVSFTDFAEERTRCAFSSLVAATSASLAISGTYPVKS